MNIIQKFTSLLMVLLLVLSPLAGAETAFNEDIRRLTESQAAQDADLIWGYLAEDGAILNPFLCTERDLLSVNQLVFESVVELNDQQKPVPLLADSWTVEGKTWTFKLRNGIHFHNGMEFVAEDVVSSYERIKQAGSTHPYYGRLSLIESMTAVDGFTLQVQARYTGMFLLYAMTFPVVERTTSDDALARGTGPYWYINYTQDSSIRLERNPLWWKQQPEIEAITCIRYYNTGEALEALQTGVINCFSTRSYTAAFSRKLSGLIATDYSTNTYEMLIPNLSSGSSMSDVRIRKAVMYAIDRATLVSNTYLDMVQQSEVPVVPGTWLYESQSAIYYYSPERALMMLNEAGWSDLTGNTVLNQLQDGVLTDLEINIVTYIDSNSSVRKNVVEHIAKNLEAVGIKVTVEALTGSEAYNRVKRGNYDLALVGVNLSEVPNLIPLFSENGAVNFAKSHTSEMDELLTRTMNTATEEALLQAYSDLQLHIVDRLPILGIGFRTGTVLSTRSMAGLASLREYNVLNGLEFVQND